MRRLHIDLETFSGVPIADAGLYRYVESPDFEILLFSYAYDDGEVVCVDLAQGESIPMRVLIDLVNPNFVKVAHNASFEWRCLSKHLGRQLPANQWRCSMLHCLYAGYPASLDAAGASLGLPEDKRKLHTGKALIRYFCVPCKPTKSNGMRTRNRPSDDPARWELFKEYNRQDVATEMAIEEKLQRIPVPEQVRREWVTDLMINTRGVAVDMDFVRGAIDLGERVRNELTQEAIEISGLSNPNSVKQLADWLSMETGDDIQTVRKSDVESMLRGDNPDHVNRMLEIRQELGKTSTKKYDKIRDAVCDDGRVRGLLQFYGANRTGRWAGRLVQVQNLPRTYLKQIDPARRYVREHNLDALHVLYGSVPDTLSQLIRTAFVASQGNVLIDADFSAIEARVISWLAGEEWRLQVFRTHGKIYEASASQMFGVPLDKIVKGNPEYALRAKGKVAELALGYQGGANALIKMGALEMGIAEDDLPDIVSRWRESNSRIVKLWYSVERAAMTAIESGREQRVSIDAGGCLIFRRCAEKEHDALVVTLPSGRELFYTSPDITRNRWDKPSLSYLGMDQNTKKWKRIETYGGKLVENIVQAIARDCLSGAIEKLEAAGLAVVFHVHDEVVIDCPKDSASLDDVIALMTQPISWAPGLPLNADGWIGNYFKKD